MKYIISILILMSCATFHIMADDDNVVFIGIPAVLKVENGVNTVTQELSKEEAQKARCTILMKFDPTHKYLYSLSSRGGIPLEKVQSGAFSIFLSPKGSGIIKYIDPELRKSLDLVDTKYDYMEILTLNLTTFTYFGYIEKFNDGTKD